jgi:import inner membrane translocase subunit TIM23
MFTEKLSATIGPSYVASFFLGGLIGLTKKPPVTSRRSRKLMINSYINNIGKTSARFGNNVGGAIFMYIMMGKFMNFLFLEEFELLSVPSQSAIFGGLTGALYKSTRGSRAMALSSILGAGIGSVYAYAWDKGLFRFNK